MRKFFPGRAQKKHKFFTILDALDGFTQLLLDDESSYLTTIQTHGVDIAGSAYLTECIQLPKNVRG